MRATAFLVGAAIILAMVPADATPPTVYGANAAYMRQWHPAATPAQVHEIASLLAGRGIVLGEEGRHEHVLDGTYVGEVWAVCQTIDSFFGPPNQCVVSKARATGVSCSSIPAHWAIFIWTPETTRWRITGGTPGFSPITYAWTTGHAGLTPISTLGRGTEFRGSGCLFEYYFGFNDEFVIGYGDGVAFAV